MIPETVIDVSLEVSAALSEKRPVVALESTLIAHGLPRPVNLETAFELESAVREEGAVPATIGILEGRPIVGLAGAQIELLATRSVGKAGTRDLAPVLGAGGSAATTVSATILLAHRAGITVMATGGLGGVHRGVTQTGDVSADLIQLSRTPVVVVCSGFKSILDLGKSLEYLETLGVPVVGYRTRHLPAFYSRRGASIPARDSTNERNDDLGRSSHDLEHSASSPSEIARIFEHSRRLGLDSALVVANPCPKREALDYRTVEELIRQAEEKAEAEGIRGKALTPFLLERLHESSGGRTLEANRALILSNARLAAQVAGVLSERLQDRGSPPAPEA